MTVVLAARATDGVVICADSAGTLLAPSGQLVAKQRREKVHSCGARFIWGASGDVGVIQRIEYRLANYHWPDFKPNDPEAFRKKVVPLVLEVLKECRKDHIGPVGPDQANVVPCAEVLFAGCLPSGPCLILIDPSGKNEIVTGSHVAIGSAAVAAMAIMQRHVGKTLTSQQTELVCYRAIDDVIRVTPIFLGEPITVGTVRTVPGSDAPSVTIVKGDETRGLRETVGLWASFESDALQKTMENLSVPNTDGAVVDEAPTVQ